LGETLPTRQPENGRLYGVTPHPGATGLEKPCSSLPSRHLWTLAIAAAARMLNDQNVEYAPVHGVTGENLWS